MKACASTQNILVKLKDPACKLGELRILAKEIKKDHGLAMELWNSRKYLARQLAILIMDKKMLSPELVDQLIKDIDQHEDQEKLPLIDWLMANQLTKDKKNIAMMESWDDDPAALKRRLFWYYQGRLRWVGQTPPPNTEKLLRMAEEKLAVEDPAVQWAINFTLAQIGIFEPAFRERCIALGSKVGLYKNEVVSKGCTPNYLPELIAIQVKKLQRYIMKDHF